MLTCPVAALYLVLRSNNTFTASSILALSALEAFRDRTRSPCFAIPSPRDEASPAGGVAGAVVAPGFQSYTVNLKFTNIIYVHLEDLSIS